MTTGDPASRDFAAEVVGCYYYHGVEGHHVGEVLKLVREPTNAHDSNAIAVYSSDCRIVGHLSRSTAAWFARELDRGVDATAVVTGIDKGTSGSSVSSEVRCPPRLYVRIARSCLPTSTVVRGSCPELIMPSPSASTGTRSQPCFILTAAYGSEFESTVCFFRSWRDRHLSHYPGGLYVIKVYWVIGPIGASALRRFPWFRVPVCYFFNLLRMTLSHFY
jgi:hypothetical protein